MKLSKEEIAEYKEEIQELTDLMNGEWIELKEILATKLDLENAYLCGYYEDEDESEYGIVMTKDKLFYAFHLDGDKLELAEVKNIKDVEDTYPQVHVAVTL